MGQKRRNKKEEKWIMTPSLLLESWKPQKFTLKARWLTPGFASPQRTSLRVSVLIFSAVLPLLTIISAVVSFYPWWVLRRFAVSFRSCSSLKQWRGERRRLWTNYGEARAYHNNEHANQRGSTDTKDVGRAGKKGQQTDQFAFFFSVASAAVGFYDCAQRFSFEMKSNRLPCFEVNL